MVALAGLCIGTLVIVNVVAAGPAVLAGRVAPRRSFELSDDRPRRVPPSGRRLQTHRCPQVWALYADHALVPGVPPRLPGYGRPSPAGGANALAPRPHSAA